MTEIAKFAPLWGVWDITRQLGSGTFGDVYEAKRRDTGREYLSAIKHISIPPKNTSMEALAAEGTVTDAASAQQYCQGLLDTLVKEIDICYELKGYTNFVSYEDHLIIPRQGEIGYDIFIRMELLTALPTYISRNGITVGEITKLCEDMCTALGVLESKNIIHRDIKPANIFINSAGEYKLGDFGVARHMEGLGSMSVKGTYNYMAAEILKGGVVGSNSDLYSLGLVLYRLLNNNRAPFLPPPPVIVGYEEEQRALDRRLQGEPLPPPDRAELSLPLTNVVMRAVEYDPARRYRSASEMKQALSDFKRSQGTPAQGIDLDATVALERLPTQVIQQGSTGSWVKKEPGSSVVFGNAPTPPGEKSNKTMFAIIFSAIGVLAVLLTVILVFVLPGNNSGDSGSMTQAPEKAAVKHIENSPQTPEPEQLSAELSGFYIDDLLPRGKAYSFSGNISSNIIIDDIVVTILDDRGNKEVDVSSYFGSDYYNLWEMGSFVFFENLSAGKKTFQLQVKCNEETTLLYSQNFEIAQGEIIYGGHSYSVIKTDVTWWGAYDACSPNDFSKHMVTIDSREEFNKITSAAFDKGLRVIWLGASRSADQWWEDANWVTGEWFSYTPWHPNEPSYIDESGEEELYLMAFCIDGTWYLNDAIENVTAYYTGRMGYVIEYEE